MDPYNVEQRSVKYKINIPTTNREKISRECF